MSAKQAAFDRKEIKKRSMFVEAMNRLMHNKSAIFGLIIMIAMILLCVFANVICPEGYNTQNIPDAFSAPFGK